MIAGLFTVAGGFVTMAAYSFPLILPVLTITAFGMGVFYLASMAYLHEIVPDSLKGTISGAYYLFWGSGYFFGPLLITQAVELRGFQAAMTVYSLLVLLVAVGMILVLGLKRAVRK